MRDMKDMEEFLWLRLSRRAGYVNKRSRFPRICVDQKLFLGACDPKDAERYGRGNVSVSVVGTLFCLYARALWGLMICVIRQLEH
jgi:hypothetical protein